jgi:hypothetical protein
MGLNSRLVLCYLPVELRVDRAFDLTRLLHQRRPRTVERLLESARITPHIQTAMIVTMAYAGRAEEQVISLASESEMTRSRQSWGDKHSPAPKIER